MDIKNKIRTHLSNGLNELFGLDAVKAEIEQTSKDFTGHFTFVVFPYIKIIRQNPATICQKLGDYMVNSLDEIQKYDVVKGFLNLSLSDACLLDYLRAKQNVSKNASKNASKNPSTWVSFPKRNERIVVEFSSPNTNKPLHLGHLRNNFLGYATGAILEKYGYDITNATLVNDRGIHICKSMLAYAKLGHDETPSASLKGDKLVGKYYVLFEKMYQEDIIKQKQKLQEIHPDWDDEKLDEQAKKTATILLEAQKMLEDWEKKDPKVLALWEKLNNWVYEGFEQTYKSIGVSFEKVYKESETYLLGKQIVQEGLDKGIFFTKEDSSVWIDLSNEGLDQKLLLRSNGTSVYLTQDLGTADLKYQDYKMTKSVYVVGNEQDYHFKVLFAALRKLGRPYAEGLYHLSYNMVDLPSGKMKSREGTVVDADELIQIMRDTAKDRTQSLGKVDDLTQDEQEHLYNVLGLGALKYFLLHISPKKRLLFDPKKSIDFQGHTGTYIQYNYAKIQAVLRRAKDEQIELSIGSNKNLESIEQELILLLMDYEQKIVEATKYYDPSLIANYAYELAKTYSKFYASLPIFGEQTSLRLSLSHSVALVLKEAMSLLGIDMPKKM